MKKLIRKTTVTALVALVLLSCLCSCSNNAEPRTTVIYIGPNGETLEPSEVTYMINTNDEIEKTEKTEKIESSVDDIVIESCVETTVDRRDDEINEAIANAEACLSEGRYDDALVALIPVKQYSDSRVAAEENRINSYKPVAIYNLDPMTRTNSDYLDAVKWKANYELNTGESGKQGIGAVTHELLAFAGYPGRTHEVTSASFEYYIGNSDFDTISGWFCLGGMSTKQKNTPLSLSLEIYADGALIYASEELTKGSLPIEVSVDIPKGTQLLKVSFVTSTTNIKDSISVEAQYSSAFVDAYFSKHYSPL